MIIFHIVYKSLRQHLVSTIVSAGAIALAGGLLMAVWVMRQESNRAFTSVTGGFDAVLIARNMNDYMVVTIKGEGIEAIQDVRSNCSAPSISTNAMKAVTSFLFSSWTARN